MRNIHKHTHTCRHNLECESLRVRVLSVINIFRNVKCPINILPFYFTLAPFPLGNMPYVKMHKMFTLAHSFAFISCFPAFRKIYNSVNITFSLCFSTSPFIYLALCENNIQKMVPKKIPWVPGTIESFSEKGAGEMDQLAGGRSACLHTPPFSPFLRAWDHLFIDRLK